MGRRMVALVVSVLAMLQVWTVTAQQFNVVHRYAHMEGSPANSGGRGASPEYHALLLAHDRRRLAAAVADFPVRGDDDPYSIGLYYTELKLGTPPRQFFVQVDTGSDVLWVNCVPCPGCPLRSGIDGVTLQLYDPALTSTEKVLDCNSNACGVASDGSSQCTSSGACEYSVKYGDGSSTSGYLVNDVLTFQQVANSTTLNATANVYFGCGTTQTGNLLSTTRAVDGIMGFGQNSVSVPTQLASLGYVGRVFAHCLQGNNLGGGTFVIGNILEPDLSYTPLVPRQAHYNVGMQNIAVDGVNITTPATFEITSSGIGGVVIDSGTTLAYIPEPAYTQFVTAITSGAPVAVTPVRNGEETLSCWIYSGNITTGFPSVTLYFDGGVEMALVASNYLYDITLSDRSRAYCMGWQKSSDAFTIIGDIVLKDHLVVYDNDKQRIGWKPFDCTRSILVSAPNSTSPVSVLPGSGEDGGVSAGAAIRLGGAVLSSCLFISLLGCMLL